MENNTNATQSSKNDFSDIINGETSQNASTSTTDTITQPSKTDGSSANMSPGDIYSDEELIDVNAITTYIADTTTPIVIFFGPASSGKTMALLRMVRYFESVMGYTVRADRTFRPSYDRNYTRMCDSLITKANDTYAPDPNDTIMFMLVTVYDNGGKPIFQILEAPGEHYFDPEVPTAAFPAYIERIIHSINNRKIWVYFVEQDWKDQRDRNNYAAKISQMQALTPKDRILFLFNKCDKQMHQYAPNGRPRSKLFMTQINNQYPGIFSRYTNSGIAKFLFGPYNFSPICFSVGTFSSTRDGRQVWNIGQDFYCEQLLKAIR